MTAVRDVEASWCSIYGHALDAAVLATPGGDILAANPRACSLLGRSEAGLRAAGHGGVLVLDEAAKRFLHERARGGGACGVITLRRGDGSHLVAEARSTTFDVDGRAPLVTLSLCDVTHRERARKALEVLGECCRVLAAPLEPTATLEALTRLVVPGLADACVVDLLVDGTVQRAAVAHRDPSRVPALREVPPDADLLQSARGLGIRSLISTPLVARGRTLGALSLMSEGGVPRFGEADVPFVCALAERTALALDNARQYADAVAARRLRDDVLNAVSHDLRGPLNAISLQAQVLQRRAPSPELDAIRVAVRRADRLIEDLLLAAKSEGGTLPLSREREEVSSMIEDAVQIYQPLADAKRVTLRTELAAGLGAVSADRHRMSQLLGNLLANAIKFTPEHGHIEVRARARAATVEVSIADSGPGIAPDELPRIFDRFWQGAHGSGAGAGLGLSIALGIARAHGGSLTASSCLGHGATFTVSLPRLDSGSF